MIKQIRLVNCQSMEDVTLNLSLDSVNVLIAKNNVGKSVFFKVLKVTACPNYFTKKQLPKLIKWGETSAKVVYTFTDGAVGLVQIFHDRVLYGYREANQTELVAYEQPPKELIDSLGLITDSKGAFIANVIDTDQDLLLVNSNLASNSDFIRLLISHDQLDILKERLGNIKIDFTSLKMQVGVALAQIKQQLNGISYLDVSSLKYSIEINSMLVDFMYSCISIHECITELISVVKFEKNWKLLFELLDDLLLLESIRLEKIEILPAVTHIASVELLEHLEGIHLENLKVCKKPELDLSMLDFLLTLEGVLNQIQTILLPLECIEISDSELTILLQLESVSSILQLIGTSSLEQAESYSEIELLEEAFIASGAKVICPIYKEVIFDGKECIPCR